MKIREQLIQSAQDEEYKNFVLETIMGIKIFKPHGPFAIREKRDGTLDIEGFWSDHRNLSQQHGCYIFAIRAGGGIRPYYVGKTTRTFAEEVFQDRNLAQFYFPVLHMRNRGTPVLFLIASPKQKGPSPSKVIDEMETFLIQQGLNANSDLKNRQKVRIPQFGIRGVIRGGMGKVASAAKEFRKTMAID